MSRKKSNVIDLSLRKKQLIAESERQRTTFLEEGQSLRQNTSHLLGKTTAFGLIALITTMVTSRLLRHKSPQAGSVQPNKTIEGGLWQKGLLFVASLLPGLFRR
jgi:hypothetical protein